MRIAMSACVLCTGATVILTFLVVSAASESDVFRYPERDVPLRTPPDGFIRPNFTMLLLVMESGHVGSTAISSMMGGTAVAVNIDECFNAQRTFRRTREEETAHFQPKFDNAAHHWQTVIDRCHQHMLFRPNATICVMKATPSHLYTEMDFLLSMPLEDLFIVYLHRRNRVQKVLSYFAAHAYSVACGKYHRSSRWTCNFPKPPLELPVEAVRTLLPYLEYLDAEANETVSTALRPYVRYSLDYEDWSRNLTHTVKSILEDVLGKPLLSERALTTHLHKMSPHSLHEAISNYDEIAAELSNSPEYLAMLDGAGKPGFHATPYIRQQWFEDSYDGFVHRYTEMTKTMNRIIHEWMDRWGVESRQHAKGTAL